MLGWYVWANQWVNMLQDLTDWLVPVYLKDKLDLTLLDKLWFDFMQLTGISSIEEFHIQMTQVQVTGETISNEETCTELAMQWSHINGK